MKKPLDGFDCGGGTRFSIEEKDSGANTILINLAECKFQVETTGPVVYFYDTFSKSGLKLSH